MSTQKSRDDFKRNKSGYKDPCAYKAIYNVDREQQDKYDAVMDSIEKVCEQANFEIIDQIILRDKKSGRVWR